jgi:hypothetical protein
VLRSVGADVDALVGAVADERALDRVAVRPAEMDAVSDAVLKVAVAEDLTPVARLSRAPLSSMP